MFLWSTDYYWWTPRFPPGLLSSDVPASETPDNMYQQAPTYYIHTYIHMYPFTHLFVLVWPCAQYESSLVMQMCHLKFFFSKPMPATPLCPPHPSYFSRSSQASPIVIGTFCSLVTAHDENKDLVRGTWYIFLNGAKVFMRSTFDLPMQFWEKHPIFFWFFYIFRVV